VAFTDINNEDRLVQATFAEHQVNVLGWTRVHTSNDENFGPDGTLDRDIVRNAVLIRDLLRPRLMSGEVAV
jgi:type I restriction enzyme, R subunit